MGVFFKFLQAFQKGNYPSPEKSLTLMYVTRWTLTLASELFSKNVLGHGLTIFYFISFRSCHCICRPCRAAGIFKILVGSLYIQGIFKEQVLPLYLTKFGGDSEDQSPRPFTFRRLCLRTEKKSSKIPPIILTKWNWVMYNVHSNIHCKCLQTNDR